ncbi:MAG: hypothetical protein D6780_03955 [Candidatus Dadabacteria bacterium]|nr:MAG: hypothetical protein D6780_03955 [Candidatus Dadabacteria bacterium]
MGGLGGPIKQVKWRIPSLRVGYLSPPKLKELGNKVKRVGNFLLLEERQIDRLKSVFRKYIHTLTGCTVFTVKTSDPENGFALAFATPPKDSKGIPHILEHLVICGSKNFSVRDPLRTILKNGSGCEISAATGGCRTIYSFKTDSRQPFFKKEFETIVRFFIDATLHPLLKPEDFDREAHHLCMVSPEDTLTRQGIVYNEMKLLLAESLNQIWNESLYALHQGSPYEHEATGIPSEIAKVRYPEVVDYHRQFYRLDNAAIFAYGDMPEEEKLRILGNVLDVEGNDAQTSPNLASISLPAVIESPRTIVVPFDPLTNDVVRQAAVSVNWQILRGASAKEKVFWQVINELLNHPQLGILSKAFREELNIPHSDAYSVVTSMSNLIAFAAVATGIDPLERSSVEAFVLKKIKDIVDRGFSKEEIDTAVSRVEWNSLPDWHPDPLCPLPQYIINMINNWVNKTNPIQYVGLVSEAMEQLKKELTENPALLSQALRDSILNNPSRVRIDFVPAPGLNQDRERREREELSRLQSTMSDEEKRQIIERTRKLSEIQDELDPEEELNKLTYVSLEDLPLEAETAAYERRTIDAKVVHRCVLPSAKAIRAYLSYDVSGFSEEEMRYLNAYFSLLPGVGTRDFEWERFKKEQDRLAVTPGVHTYFSLTSQGELVARLNLVLEIFSPNKSEEAVKLIEQLIRSPRFDDLNRLKQLPDPGRASLYHFSAKKADCLYTRLLAAFSPDYALRERVLGIEQILFARRLGQLSNPTDYLSEFLRYIHTRITSSYGEVIVVANDDDYKKFKKKALSRLVSNLPSRQRKLHTPLPLITPENEFISQDTGAGHCGCCASVSDGVNIGVKGRVAASIIQDYLWREIRRKGGAYGAYTNYDVHSGILAMWSGSDSSIARTIGVFQKAADFLEQAREIELRQAIAVTIASITKHSKEERDRAAKEVARILDGISPEIIQDQIDQVLSTTLEDCKLFAEALRKAQFKTVVIGPRSSVKGVRGVDNKPFREIKL